MNEDALADLERRVGEYRRSGDPRLILSDRALTAARSLRGEAGVASVLGWFHYLRFNLLPDGEGDADFALAVLLFGASGEVPEPLSPLLGARPDPQAQAEAAGFFAELGSASGDPDVLRAGADLFERALAARHPDRVGWLTDLGVAYMRLYDHTRAPADLRAGIDRHEQALAALPRGHFMAALPRINLADAYLDRFLLTGELADLRTCIDHGEQAVALIPADHPHGAVPLSTLGLAYQYLYDRTYLPVHLDAAVDRYGRAVAACPPGHPERPVYLVNLARAHLARYESGGVLDDLGSAIEHAKESFATSTDRVHRGHCLGDLAGAYLRRYGHTGDRADLELAIDHGEQALATGPADHPVTLSILGVAHVRRFEATDVPADLRAGIGYAERALAAVPDDHADRATYLSEVGLAHLARFGRLGEDPAIDVAVDHLTRAVEHTARGDPQFPVRLSNLAGAYLRRYEHTGEPADLRAAIDFGEEAVAAAAADHPDRAMCLSNLGAAYAARYDHDEDLADLRRRIDLAEEAVAATPAGDPALAGRLSNLGTTYQRRYERTGEPGDMRTAIEYGERALSAVPQDDPDRGMYLINLSVAHGTRWERHPDPADLAAVVRRGEQAVAATPQGHPKRASYLSTLGMAYGARFGFGWDPADLAAAADRCEQAIALTPPGHPDRASHLANLAVVCRMAREPAVSPAARPGVVSRLREYATGLDAAPPAAQVRAAHEVGIVLEEIGDWAGAARLFGVAVRALRGVAPRHLSRADRERQLGSYPGLVGEAIAAHLEIGDVDGAVELAELGRGILLAAELDTRTDLNDLDEHAPELAGEFRRLRDALNADVSEGRRELAERWDRLLDRIHRRDGFEHFLEPPRPGYLRESLPDGTAVLVNAAPGRCDAILLRADGIRSIRLPDLTLGAMRTHTADLLRAVGTGSLAGSLARGRVVPEVLAWLWETVAGPVLDALGHRERPSGVWPRVWWVPTGELSLLPLHAAGTPGGPSAPDRVVSSYAPTIRTLRHSMRPSAARTRAQLTVALRHTPGRRPLDGTVAEALDLHASRRGVLLIDEAAAAADVLTALQESTWAHFACHASSDPAEPSRSGLLLHDASLTVPRIGAQGLAAAELVYLSACSTAQAGRHQPEEAIHLASAFQLAGFRHVIAALWPIDDAVAATAARRFYELLPDSPSADDAPYALHQVIQELRSEHADRPDLWALSSTVVREMTTPWMAKLLNDAEALSLEGRFPAALESALTVLSVYPDSAEALQHAARLVYTGMRRGVPEPLTAEQLGDTRLDAAFCSCEQPGCYASWISAGTFMPEKVQVRNPRGCRCEHCGGYFCRNHYARREDGVVKCPRCGGDVDAAPRVSNGRPSVQTARHNQTIVHVEVMREGAGAMSPSYMTTLLKTMAPDVFEDHPSLSAGPVTDWLEDSQTMALMRIGYDHRDYLSDDYDIYVYNGTDEHEARWLIAKVYAKAPKFVDPAATTESADAGTPVRGGAETRGSGETEPSPRTGLWRRRRRK